MKRLVELMVDYKNYHSNPLNQYLHYIGVPLIVFSSFLALGWFRFIVPEIHISLAMMLFLSGLIYYMRLDLKAGGYAFFVWGGGALFSGVLCTLSFCDFGKNLLSYLPLWMVHPLFGSSYRRQKASLL